MVTVAGQRRVGPVHAAKIARPRRQHAKGIERFTEEVRARGAVQPRPPRLTGRGQFVAVEGGGGAVGQQVFLQIVVGHAGEQIGKPQRPLGFEGQIERLLLVFARRVEHETEIDRVGVLIEIGRAEIIDEAGNGKGRVEVDRPGGYLGVAGAQIQGEVLVDPPLQTAASTGVVEKIHRIVSVTVDILVKTVGLARAHGHTSEQLVLDQRAAQHGAGAPRAHVGDGGADAALEGLGRLFGGDQNRAGHGVAAVERALGAFQHLDLAHVEKLFIETVRIGAEDAIDHVGNRRLGVAGRDDAAYAELRIAHVGGVDQGHIGDQADIVRRAFDPGALDRALVERRDGNGHVLQVFRPLARQHHDLFDGETVLLGEQQPRGGDQ